MITIKNTKEKKNYLNKYLNIILDNIKKHLKKFFVFGVYIFYVFFIIILFQSKNRIFKI